MFNFPHIFYDADDGQGGANTQPEQKNENTTDYGKLLEGVDLDELLKQDAISKKIQSIADSRVTQAIATAKTKWEKELTETQTEAGKLAKMTEAEKQQYQFEKDKKAFEAEKAQFNHSRLQVETAKQLISYGLPDLSAFVTGKDAEETKTNITNLQAILGAWKAAALKEAMAGKTPTEPNKQGAKLTRADLKKMTPAEINKAYAEGRIDFTK